MNFLLRNFDVFLTDMKFSQNYGDENSIIVYFEAKVI